MFYLLSCFIPEAGFDGVLVLSGASSRNTPVGKE